jgi:hypothetical protein
LGSHGQDLSSLRAALSSTRYSGIPLDCFIRRPHKYHRSPDGTGFIGKPAENITVMIGIYAVKRGGLVVYHLLLLYHIFCPSSIPKTARIRLRNMAIFIPQGNIDHPGSFGIPEVRNSVMHDT